MDTVAEHVVTVACNDAAQRVSILYNGVAHRPRVALDIEQHAGCEKQVSVRLRWVRTVIHEGQEGTPQRVEVSGRRGIRMGGGALCGLLLRCANPSADARLVPGGK